MTHTVPSSRRHIVSAWCWPALATILLLVRLVIATQIAREGARRSPDFDRFWSIATSSAQPYTSYQVEYTPFAVESFKLVQRAAPGRASFGAAMVWIAFMADLIATAAIARAFGWEAAAVYLLVSLPLVDLFYNRFDLVPTAAAVLTVAQLRRGRPVSSAVALVTAVGFKLWPLPLSALLLGQPQADARRSATLALLIGGVIVGLASLGWAGAQGAVQVVTFRGASGWQIETLAGNLIALSSHRTLRYELNAYRVGTLTSQAVVAWLTIGMEVAFALAWLGTRARSFGVTWLCSIGALLMFSPLFSPQFMAWIAPPTALAWVERRRVPAVFGALALLLTSAFWAHYNEVLSGSWWESVVTARNVAVFLMTAASAMAIVPPALGTFRTRAAA